MRLAELIPTKDTAEIRYGDTDLWAEIRYTDEVLLKEIRARTTGRYSRRRSNLGEIDTTAITDAYADLVLVRFWGVTIDDPEDTVGVNGNKRQIPYPCTEKTKRELLHRHNDVKNWIAEEAADERNFILHDPKDVEEDQKK